MFIKLVRIAGKSSIFVLVVFSFLSCLRTEMGESEDWLLSKGRYPAEIKIQNNAIDLVMTNGLIERSFRLSPNAATVGFSNLMTGESILRGVKPEAVLKIDGQTHSVGGLVGQVEYAYLLPEWLDSLKTEEEAFQFVKYSIGETKKRFPWNRKRYSADLPCPPPGVSLSLDFRSNLVELRDVVVSVHYEMYDDIPLLSKWITVMNGMEESIQLDSFTSEILAVVEAEVAVEENRQWSRPNMHVESDYALLGMSAKAANKTTHWVPDPQYLTQVNYQRLTPCLLESRPPIGPGISIEPGETFESFRTYELIFDSTDRERNGLAQRRMYRTIAPWATENPIFMHLTSSDSDVIRQAIDQCVEVGFEMVIISFGSKLNMENEDPAYIERFKDLADYAHEKGIELGGYSLLASRRISDEHDVINPKTGKTGGAIFGNSPCLGSEWGEEYFRKLTHFFEKTGFDLLEHDGSYPGDLCASTEHPGHRGLEDSQWTQWKTITDFYKWCRDRGVYLNVPDWYFLSGSNKTGMGYRETNWSLPRERQIVLGRQNIYDGTWTKTPSMGWMFVPLVEYHGGGEAATLEPLSEHLDAYEAHLVQNFGAGVQACYRGPRLYDTEKTKDLVKETVAWYKKYRDILNSDIIHVRRPDGRDWDCILHVNPWLVPRGLAMVYNPTNETIEKPLTLPLYFTGLSDRARIREKEGEAATYSLDRKYRVEIPVKVAPKSFTWFVIE
jgi:hypothetical protein